MRANHQMNIGILWSNGCSLHSWSCFGALSLPFPFAFPLFASPVAGLSSSRFLAFETRTLDFLLEMSLCHPLLSGTIKVMFTKSCLVSVDLPTHFSTLPTFQFAPCTDSPKKLSVGPSASADNATSHLCRRPEGSRSLNELLTNLWSPRWLHCPVGTFLSPLAISN